MNRRRRSDAAATSRCRLALLALIALGLGACASAPAGGPGDPSAAAAAAAGAPTDQDTGATGLLVPPGYGTLKQDDIAVKFIATQVQIKAIPLDESVIRLLSPDSYRALHDLHESRRGEIAQVERRFGGQPAKTWYIQFFGLQPDVTFSPRELSITNGGRDFRPVELIPLTSGFGDQRLRQREMQGALYLFESALDVTQPLTVTYETQRNDSWGSILRRLEQERAQIRSRAAKAPRP